MKHALEGIRVVELGEGVSAAHCARLLADFGADVAQAEMLVENFLPPRARELGVEWEALSRVNPELVMVSITPFGRTGPYAEWKGYDLNAYHLTAAGHRYCGRPGEAPLEHGTFSAEFFGAAAAAAWGLAATLGRARGGGGAHPDV